MRRFLVDADLAEGSRLTLSPEESRHALKSLRLTAGDSVLLTDGKGTEAEGKLLNGELEGALVEVLKVRKIGRSVSLEVLQAPLKGPKMDWLVEKLTELGVSVIHLVKTRYTIAPGDKLDRWRRLAQAAVKQSGNPLVPQIKPLSTLQEAAKCDDAALCILLQPGASRALADLIREKRKDHQRILLAIGPEGGFAPEEEEMLLQAGFLAAALSPQVLRGETAALAAVAIASHSVDF